MAPTTYDAISVLRTMLSNWRFLVFSKAFNSTKDETLHLVWMIQLLKIILGSFYENGFIVIPSIDKLFYTQ